MIDADTLRALTLERDAIIVDGCRGARAIEDALFDGLTHRVAPEARAILAGITRLDAIDQTIDAARGRGELRACLPCGAAIIATAERCEDCSRPVTITPADPVIVERRYAASGAIL